jgi:hypothetical protein
MMEFSTFLWLVGGGVLVLAYIVGFSCMYVAKRSDHESKKHMKRLGILPADEYVTVTQWPTR